MGTGRTFLLVKYRFSCMCTLNAGAFRPCRLMMPYLEPPILTSFTVKRRSLVVSAWRETRLHVTSQTRPRGHQAPLQEGVLLSDCKPAK